MAQTEIYTPTRSLRRRSAKREWHTATSLPNRLKVRTQMRFETALHNLLNELGDAINGTGYANGSFKPFFRSLKISEATPAFLFRPEGVRSKIQLRHAQISMIILDFSFETSPGDATIYVRSTAMRAAKIPDILWPIPILVPGQTQATIKRALLRILAIHKATENSLPATVSTLP